LAGSCGSLLVQLIDRFGLVLWSGFRFSVFELVIFIKFRFLARSQLIQQSFVFLLYGFLLAILRLISRRQGNDQHTRDYSTIATHIVVAINSISTNSWKTREIRAAKCVCVCGILKRSKMGENHPIKFYFNWHLISFWIPGNLNQIGRKAQRSRSRFQAEIIYLFRVCVVFF